MKLIRYAAILLFASACSQQPSVQEQRDTAQPAPESATKPAVSEPQKPPPPVTDRTPPAAPKAAARDDRPVGTTASTVVDGKAVNTDAMVMADFKTRVDKYLDVRKKAKKDAPPLKETREPARIKAGEKGLAVEIRALRDDAKPGDIFTPAVRDVFRRLLYPKMKGDDGHDVRATLKDDAPASVPLKVNADYPEGASLPTVPAALLVNLPTLPKELDYRIVNKNLILRDVDANLIVDYMPNVIR